MRAVRRASVGLTAPRVLDVTQAEVRRTDAALQGRLPLGGQKGAWGSFPMHMSLSLDCASE
jgi:hypothetical protein